MLRLFLPFTLAFALTPLIEAEDWPQLHTARSTTVIPLRPNSIGPGRKKARKVLWKMDAGHGWAGPVVAGERLILFTASTTWRLYSASIRRPERRSGNTNTARSTRTISTSTTARVHAPTIAGGQSLRAGPNGDLTAARNSPRANSVWQRNLLDDYKASKGFFGSVFASGCGRQTGW